MNAVALAKRRARGRRGQSGAAMFIVAMTLAVLASVGVFALAAAANEVRTSGNERQSTQTHYLAEYGIIGAAHEISDAVGNFQIAAMFTNPLRETACVALPGVPSTAPDMTRACRRLGSADLANLNTPWTAHIVEQYTATDPLSSSVNPGSFGPVPMNGDFFVELTDPSNANPPAGYATNLNLCFKEIAVTAGGITQPVFPGIANPTAGFAGEGIEFQRARFVVGPGQCDF
jgi:Tfp pilus assembly protein PilX